MATVYRCDRPNCGTVSETPLNRVELIKMATSTVFYVNELCMACFDQIAALLGVDNG
jgi:hypothetical protein